MAVTYRTGTSVTATASNPPAITIPGTVASGDVLVLSASSDGAAPGSDPAGWTRVFLGSGVSTNTTSFAGIWTKIATGGDAGSSVTPPAGGSTGNWIVTVDAWSSAASIRTASGTSGNDNPGTRLIPAPTASATGGDKAIYVWCAVDWTTPGVLTADAATTSRRSVSLSATGVRTVVADEAISSTGTTTTRNAGNTVKSGWCSAIIDVVPSAVVTPYTPSPVHAVRRVPMIRASVI